LDLTQCGLIANFTLMKFEIKAMIKVSRPSKPAPTAA